MANRLVFGFSVVLVVLFFLLSNFERYFFLLHFLQSALFLVILVLLFYRLEEWAYVLGFLTSLLWLLLAVLQGMFFAGMRGLGQLAQLKAAENPIDAVTGVIVLAQAALAVTSGYAYRKESWGLPEAKRAALWGAAIIGVYYTLLIYALFRLSRPEG